jgi:hypothetical protein
VHWTLSYAAGLAWAYIFLPRPSCPPPSFPQLLLFTFVGAASQIILIPSFVFPTARRTNPQRSSVLSGKSFEKRGADEPATHFGIFNTASLGEKQQELALSGRDW